MVARITLNPPGVRAHRPAYSFFRKGISQKGRGFPTSHVSFNVVATSFFRHRAQRGGYENQFRFNHSSSVASNSACSSKCG